VTGRCAVCPEPAEGEIRIRRLGRPGAVVLRLCAIHTRRAYRSVSTALTADLDSDRTGPSAGPPHGLNPYRYEALRVLKGQAERETDPARRVSLERAIAEREAAIAAQEEAAGLDFLLWELE
jgi:hypothetical protein